MSSSVDQRIVKMQFDNSQFESNAKTSLSTLEKLKESLKFSGASKGIEDVKESVKGLKLDSVASGVEQLGLKFDAMHIIAKRALENITDYMMGKLSSAIKNTIGLISSGGMRRAQNLEQARFSMQGLLESTDEAGNKIHKFGITVEDVMKEGGPVQNAVSGTAYGLDEAAKAASNFIASGITDLGDLEQALSSISGSAAQTGSSYEDIARLYGKVAGQGRLMGDDLNSMAARGVNAAATLADYVNGLGGDFSGMSDQFKEAAAKIGKTTDFTEADIRDMVSKAGIDFKLFSNAMYEAFGENAFRANETFSGSLSNMKAALSRLGAKFATPYLNNMRDIFNALRPTIDSISKSLDPLINKINDLFSKLTEFTVGKIGKVKDFFDNLVNPKVADDFERVGESIEKSKKKIDNLNISPVQILATALGNLASSAKNFGSGLGNILSPIGSALKDILTQRSAVEVIRDFAKNTLETSKSFKTFTEESSRLKKATEQIGQIIKDVANVFKNLLINMKPVASFIGSTLGPIISTLGGFFIESVSKITSFVSTLTDIITENELVYLAFKKLSDFLNGVFGPVFNWLKNIIGGFLDSVNFDGVTKGFSSLAEKAAEFLRKESDFSNIGNTIVGVLERIKKWLSPVADGFDKVKNSIGEFFSKLSSNVEGISLFEKISSIFEKIGSILGSVASKIGSGLSSIGKALTDNLDPKRITGIASLSALAANGGILYLLFNFVSGLKSSFDGIKGTFDNVVGALLQLKDVLGGYEKDISPDGIKTIAIAIGILAASVTVLSMIDPGKLTGATVAMGALMGELVGAIKLIEQITSNKQQASAIRKMATALVVLSSALLIASSAFKKLAELDWDQIAKGVVAIGSLLVMMTAYVKAMSEIGKSEGQMVKAGSTLLALAVAINILSSAVKKLGELDISTLAKGLTSVALLIGALGLFTKFAEVNNIGLSSGLGITALAVGVNILARAVEKFGDMNVGTIVKGLGVMAIAMAEVAAFVSLVDGGDVMAKSVALTITAAALLVLASAMKKMGEIPVEQLTNALISMAASMGIIVAAMNLMPKDSILTAAAIVAMATGILVLSAALTVLGAIPLNQIAVALGALVATLVIFGAAASLLGPLTPIMIALSAAMALFGAGLLAVAAAIALLTPVLVAFSTAVVGSAEIILSGIVTLGEQLVLAISTIIEAILLSIQSNMTLVLETIALLISGVLQLVVEFTPQLLETVGILLDAFLSFVVEYVPKVVDAGLQLLLGLIQGIANNIQQIVEAAFDVVINFINGVANKLPAVIDAGFNLLLSFINGIADAVKTHSYEMGEAAWNLVEALITGFVKAIAGFFSQPVEKIKELGKAVLNGLKEHVNAEKFKEKIHDAVEGLKGGIGEKLESAKAKISELANAVKEKLGEILSFDNIKQIGSDMISGLIEGIGSLADSAIGGIKSFGQNMLSGLKGILGINSPSTEMRAIGENTIQGFHEGISDYSSVTNTLDSMGRESLENLGDNFSLVKMIAITTNAVSGLVKGINNSSSGLKTLAKQTAQGTKDAMANVLSSGNSYSIGSNLIAGIKNGIGGMWGSLTNYAYSLGRSVISSMKNALGVHSPSTEFMAIGEYCIDGMVVGLSETKDAIRASESLGNDVVNGINSSISGVEDIDPTIRPILDLSQIQNGVSKIDSLLDRDAALTASIAGNVNSISTKQTIQDGLNNLANMLNGLANEQISPDEIYRAILEGASNARFDIFIDGKRITSTVNAHNTDFQIGNLRSAGVY